MKQFIVPIFLLIFLAASVSCIEQRLDGLQPMVGELAENQYDSGCLPNEIAYPVDEDYDAEERQYWEPDPCVENVELIWNGARLAVDHFCHFNNAAASFVISYRVEEGLLDVYQYNKLDTDTKALCSCYFETAGEMEIPGGDYQFRLIAIEDDGRETIVDEAISLPAGEERQYSYSP